MPERIAVVMAGGGGTRLWPASIASRPKPLLDPLLEGHTLLRATIARLAGFIEPDAVWVVTTREQEEMIAAALPPDAHVLAEPYGRNTAPCLALSVATLRQTHPDATLVVLPADHHVADPAGLRQLLATACVHAEAGNAVVTLGIEPDRPATGYGYIERDAAAVDAVPADGDVPVFAAKRFVEKPDVQRAREFVQSGRYLWNAGIFVMPLPRIADELARHCPAVWQPLDADPTDLDTAYAAAKAEPIDTAVMEKLADLRVVPARVGWTDLGSWQSVLEVAQRDEHGNAALGRARAPVLIDCKGTLVWADSAQVAAIGLRDMVVVQARDGIVVCPREQAQRVREVAARLTKTD